MSAALRRFPFRLLLWTRIARVLLALVSVHSTASAHQVPSLTVEALFSAGRGYTLRVNVDPRLIISDQPSSLPPVPIEWYRDQKPEELAATEEKASGYLRKALSIRFGEITAAVEKCRFQPMDGATNMPLSEDTKEVHLLAEMKGYVPEGQSSFSLSLSHDANVSMILMNSFEGAMERRPNVVFPGESSRPFPLAFPVKPGPQAITAPNEPPTPGGDQATPGRAIWGAVGIAMILAAILGARWWRRTRI